MQIDTVVFFQITDPKLYAYGVENPIMAIENLSATTLRNIIGDMELDETLTSREVINTKMRASLDVATDPWGIKVNRVELKNIIPPAAIQEAMEKQMKAERERREAIDVYKRQPMDFIPQYIRGKNRPDTIHYDCPQLEPILKATHGCIVYQEQVMQIVQSLAGFTLGRSDLLRRAMSKKKLNVMEKERQAFVYGNEAEGVPGCIKNGIDEKIANKIYDEMIDFAQYAFNKSHAAAYAYVTYQTAFLKYYYPVEYMAALMTSVIDKPTKVAEYIQVCRQMNIPILPPDINKGEYGFSVSGRCV